MLFFFSKKKLNNLTGEGEPSYFLVFLRDKKIITGKRYQLNQKRDELKLERNSGKY